jgi:hypothetical protein
MSIQWRCSFPGGTYQDFFGLDALGGDVKLEGFGLAVLWESKIQNFYIHLYKKMTRQRQGKSRYGGGGQFKKAVHDTKTTVVLRITIEKFVNENKVVLDSLLVKLSKVTLANLDELVKEFKDESGVGVALCESSDIQVLVLDMKERDGPHRCHWRSNIRGRNHLKPKDIREIASRLSPSSVWSATRC